jgi:glycosyltransferase involved in cell wall biosynthesis
LKVDFWDTREMADKICAVLSYPKLAEVMVKNCREEMRNIRWSNAADLLNTLYRELIARRGA